MARAHALTPEQRQRETLFWLQFGLFAAVILILIAIIWALMTVSSVDSAAPRSIYERQLRTAEAAVKSAPDNAGFWADYIRLQVIAEKLDDARKTVASADEALGKRAAAIGVEEARIALKSGDIEGARSGIAEAIKLVDEEIAAEVKRLEAAGVVQKPDPTLKISALLLQAEILVAAADDAGAISAYSAALELDPTMADVLVDRGLLEQKAGDADAAAADFKRALEFIPDYQPALDALESLEAAQ